MFLFQNLNGWYYLLPEKLGAQKHLRVCVKSFSADYQMTEQQQPPQDSFDTASVWSWLNYSESPDSRDGCIQNPLRDITNAKQLPSLPTCVAATHSQQLLPRPESVASVQSLEQVELDCYDIVADLKRQESPEQTMVDEEPSVVQRLLNSETAFVTSMEEAMQRYSLPLRHSIISSTEHRELFQNIEKVNTMQEIINMYSFYMSKVISKKSAIYKYVLLLLNTYPIVYVAANT